MTRNEIVKGIWKVVCKLPACFAGFVDMCTDCPPVTGVILILLALAFIPLVGVVGYVGIALLFLAVLIATAGFMYWHVGQIIKLRDKNKEEYLEGFPEDDDLM